MSSYLFDYLANNVHTKTLSHLNHIQIRLSVRGTFFFLDRLQHMYVHKITSIQLIMRRSAKDLTK